MNILKDSTPRPWRTSEAGGRAYVEANSRVAICDCGRGAAANAALIVLAVNSHERLVEACKTFCKAWDEDTLVPNTPRIAPADALAMVQAARAALAAAGESPGTPPMLDCDCGVGTPGHEQPHKNCPRCKGTGRYTAAAE